MSDQSSKYYLLFAFFLLAIVSCTPSVPGRYIQPDEMESILYDYHIADAMYQSDDGKATTMIVYKAAILKKHGVSEADFDSSMVYYTRHTRLLQKIYESLSTRLSKEAMALGATATEINQHGLNSANGDTTNVWKGEQSMVFSPYRPFNLSSFTLKTDTAYKAGDKLLLNFDTQFIYQDGSREAVAMLSVKFNNDSISSQNVFISTANHYTLQISDDKHVGIKEIKGYFILNNGNSSDMYSTTFKLMIISNISLIRIHPPKQTRKVDAVSDTTSSDTKRRGGNDLLRASASRLESSRSKRTAIEKIPASAAIK